LTVILIVNAAKKVLIMKLSEFKKNLINQSEVKFKLPNGEFVPSHFHITEVGKIDKHFIDCGGTIRNESLVGFQLWKTDDDLNHRLTTEKLMGIIELSEDKLSISDVEIEVEYQSETIGKYGVEFNGFEFTLENKHTDCLAKDNCGVPVENKNVKLSELQENSSSCDPTSGCC
jgi:hypothetical protein